MFSELTNEDDEKVYLSREIVQIIIKRLEINPLDPTIREKLIDLCDRIGSLPLDQLNNLVQVLS